MQAIAAMQAMDATLQLHRRLTFKHVKELTRMGMAMPLLKTTRGHALFDHTQIVRRKQMPTIAGLTPRIVFGVRATDRRHIAPVTKSG